MKSLYAMGLMVAVTGCSLSDLGINTDDNNQTNTQTAKVNVKANAISNDNHVVVSSQHETLLKAQLNIKPKTVTGDLPLTLLVFNIQKHAVTLFFRSGMTADLWLVNPDGERLWAWSNTMMFTQAQRQLKLASGMDLTVDFILPKAILSLVNEPGYKLEVKFAGVSIPDPSTTVNQLTVLLKQQ